MRVELVAQRGEIGLVGRLKGGDFSIGSSLFSVGKS